jgi:hypothetical protein
VVRAILVNPQEQVIRKIEVEAGLKPLQALVGGHIEGIYPGNFVRELEGCHGYVNEEFLYTHPEWRAQPWRIGPYEYLCGPGVFLGSDGAGNEADCPVSLVTLAKHVEWLRVIA